MKMGCDIHGWLEIKQDAGRGWEAVLDLSKALSRDYEVFGLLFGVRNSTGLEPLAFCRGLPADVSEKAKADADAWRRYGHSHSYLTLAELEAYDWGRIGRGEHICHYEWQGCGNWAFKGKLVLASFPAEVDAALKRGEKVLWAGERYHLEEVHASDIREKLNGLILARMRRLAKRCRPSEVETAQECVRLVVWFDN